jgi:hypothetical protein
VSVCFLTAAVGSTSLKQTHNSLRLSFTQDIDSSVGFRTNPVVWGFRTGNYPVSVWDFRTGTGVGFPYRFLNLV